MSGPQAKPFKARLGIDANNEKVINVKDPSDNTDAINVQYLVAKNTVPQFDATRAYPTGFIVERSDRLYKAKAAISVGAFDLNAWSEIHAFNLWQRIAGAYTAEPGDCLLLNTASSSVTITLPVVVEEGDMVYIIDEGTASTNPIILSAGTNTFNNSGVSTYSINSSDTTQVVFLGGTWRVIRIARPQYQLINSNQTVAPNTFNYVQLAATPITVILPINPIQGQWVVVADGVSNASNYNITINGNGKTISGSASYVINRSGSIVSMLYDQPSGEWKAVSVASTGRRMETLTPLVNQSVFVTLDGTAKTLNLPVSTSVSDGDWVEVITKFQDTVATGSLVVTASGGGFFRMNGAAQNTTTYRIKQRSKTLFLYKGGEWSIFTTNDTTAVPAISTGSMISNSFVTLTGASGQTILLPQNDQVRIGDTVTAVINSTSFSVNVGLQNTSTQILDGGVANLTYTAADNGLMVTYIYRGWNGSKYVWESIVHGSPYLKKTSNLSDLPDPSVARTTLNVYSKSEADAKFLGASGSTAAMALDTVKVGGVIAAQMAQNTATALVGDDPNTTGLNLIVTNHINTPNAGATYWYINTVWTGSISNTSARFQMAYQYTGNPAIEFRQYNPAGGGTWSDWITVSTIVDGSTYNINILGLASTASKLNIARTINGVNFDGTANITVADATKLPTTGGLVTGPISRAGTSVKVYDQVLSKFVGGGSGTITGTLKVVLPVGYNSTMMKMHIGIFDSGTDKSNTELVVGGYNYSGTPAWTNVSASTNGGPTSAIGQTVRFAFDGVNNCILIGTTTSVWAYPSVTVKDVNLSFTGASLSGWDTGAWDAAVITSETGITVTATAAIDVNIAKLDRSVNLFSGEVQSGGINSYRQVQGNYGTFWRNDGANLYLMQTASGDAYGTYNSYRPLIMTLATGAMQSSSNWTFNANLSVLGALTASGTATFSGTHTFAGTTTHSNWWRSSGSTGWMSQDFGGGIFMQDTTWVRVYGSKGLYVSNDIASTGNVIAYYSDKRLKENLKPIANALDTVRSWTGYTYNANALGASFGYDPEKQEIGLLAQDVQATTPQAVERAPFDTSDVKGGSLTGENYLTLKYERLVPVLVEAIKEQDKEIQTLKQQVAALIAAISK
jgi:hypothetical protein